MAYAAYMAKAGYSLPAGFGAFVAAWAVLHLHSEPPPGHREIALAEWDATPGKYLLHPDLHPAKFARVPGLKKVPNEREELFERAHYKDPTDVPLPKHSAGHHH